MIFFHVTDWGATSPTEIQALIPGVWEIKQKKGFLRAPRNAAWLVAPTLKNAGATFEILGTRDNYDKVKSQLLPEGSGLRDGIWQNFMMKHQRESVNFACNYSGTMLVHPPGCLTGETELVVNRGGNAKRIMLETLVAKLNGAGSDGGSGTRYWDLSIPTKTQCMMPDGTIRLNTIIRAVVSGEKEVFKLRTVNGQEIKATADHKFWGIIRGSAPNWHPLSSFREGDAVYMEKWPVAGEQLLAPKLYDAAVRGLNRHPHAIRTSSLSDSGNRSWYVKNTIHVLIAEAEMNGLSLYEFVGRVFMGDLDGLKFINPATHCVHHKDGNHYNNDPKNLEVITHVEHAREHGQESAKNVLAKAVPVEIQSITSCGVEMTYDLTMEDPHNNYVANGFVVHNSGKSLSAIAWALRHAGKCLWITRAISKIPHAKQIAGYCNADVKTQILDGEGPHALRVKLYRSTRRLAKGAIVNINSEDYIADDQGEVWVKDHFKKSVELHAKYDSASASIAVGGYSNMHTEVIINFRHGEGDEYPEVTTSVQPHIDPDARFVIINWEIIAGWYPLLEQCDFKSIVFDECFPAGTLVETDHGPIAIENIKRGDHVASIGISGNVEFKPVRRTIARPMPETMAKITVGDRSLIATGNHEVWTDEHGFTNADQLQRNNTVRGLRERCFGLVQMQERMEKETRLQPKMCWKSTQRQENTTYDYNGVLDLCEAIPARSIKRASAFLWPKLQREMAHVMPNIACSIDSQAQQAICKQGQTSPLAFGEDETKQSDAQAREHRENAAEENWPNISVAGWKWAVNEASIASGFNYRLADGNSDWSRQFSSIPFTTKSVQGGSGSRRGESSNRGGWINTQNKEMEVFGPPQDGDTEALRVDSIEILERRSVISSLQLCGDYPLVYTLEVEDNHNYFANGLLVGNCHKAKAAKRYVAIHSLNAEEKTRFTGANNTSFAAMRLSRARSIVRRLATTATPVKDRVRDLWAQLDLILPYEFGGRADFMNRYCNRHQGTYGQIDDTGSSNIDELKKRFSMVRHAVSIKETHAALPPLRRETIYIPADQLIDVKEKKAITKLAGASALEHAIFQAAARKRPYVIDSVLEALENNQNITVFTGRREDAESIYTKVKSKAKKQMVLLAHGGISVAERENSRTAYMQCTTGAALIATGDSMGEGIDLNRTDVALLAQLPFTGAQLDQWEKRFWRLGSDRNVIIRYLIATGTIDERIASLLLSKLPAVEKLVNSDAAELSHALMGGKSDAEIQSDLINMLLKGNDNES